MITLGCCTQYEFNRNTSAMAEVAQNAVVSIVERIDSERIKCRSKATILKRRLFKRPLCEKIFQ